MRLKLISCGMFEREVYLAVSRSPNQIQLELLPANLHQLTAREILRGVQNLVERIDRTQFQAVLLFCGACKNSLAGLHASAVPIVLPRAHDCISLLLEAPKAPLRRARTNYGFTADFGEAARASFPASASGFWMAPVKETASELTELILEREWKWREHLSPGPVRGASCAARFSRWGAPQIGTPRAGPNRWRRPWPRSKPLPLLQRLVNGYWSHDDFLVVLPGWQTVLEPGRNQLGAEEIPT